MKNPRHVKIFDTTLRDGQQCPGAGMSAERNMEYARLAARLKVDVLEAGFPSASLLDFEIVRSIASEYARLQGAPVAAALCQLRPEQIERTIEALRPAISCRKARLHTYVPVSPALMEASLGDKSADKHAIVQQLHALVKTAVQAGCEVQFSPEGYSRVGGNFDFCTELIRAAVAGGATIINCPDTIGGACSAEGKDYFVRNMQRHAEIIAREFPAEQVIWSVHCHNDFGLAVTNSVNAVFDGPATQIEGCINGIGERAGNASLEQCIMVINQFGTTAAENTKWFCTVETRHLQEISNFVSDYMLPRQPHSPVCGENAARHSSGGHTNAILKNPMAYQPFDPAQVGQEISLVFGPLSGGNHAEAIIKRNGYQCRSEEKAAIAQFIKDRFQQRRKGITDKELLSAYFQYRAPMTIERLEYSKKEEYSQVTFKGSFKGTPFAITQNRQGADSALAALKIIIDQFFGAFDICSHSSRSEGSGISAISRSEIEIIDKDGTRCRGWGEDRDIEIAAMKALVDAANRRFVNEHYKIRQIENVSQSSAIAHAQPLSAAS